MNMLAHNRSSCYFELIKLSRKLLSLKNKIIVHFKMFLRRPKPPKAVNPNFRLLLFICSVHVLFVQCT